MKKDARNDRALLAEFGATRSGAPFEELVRRHYPMVLGVCRRSLKGLEDAEDAAQAVFLTLAQKAGSLAGRESVAGWLYWVAVHESQNARRLIALRRKREQEAGEVKEESTHREREWERLKPLFDLEVAALPEKYRLPLVLHQVEGRTEPETAKDLGCGVGAVSMRLSRAREMLRSRLARRGVVVGGGLLFGLIAEKVASAATAVTPAAMASVVKSAALVAAEKSVEGLVSAHVSALVQGGLKAMMVAKIKVVAVAAAAVSMVGLAAGTVAYQTLPEREEIQAAAVGPKREAPLRKGSKEELTPETFEGLHKAILPQPGEWKWDAIPWLTNVWEARKRAIAEDKPIFSVYLGGAGFNDLLGGC